MDCTVDPIRSAGGPGWVTAQEEQQPQTAQKGHYTVKDLGTLGGGYSFGYGVNKLGVVAGGAATTSQTDFLSQTAFLWDKDLHIVNLGTLGGDACPACSSEAAQENVWGEAAILSETASPAYEGEDFCGFGTHRQCLAGIWKNGEMSALSCPSAAATMDRLSGLTMKGRWWGLQKMTQPTQPAPPLRLLKRFVSKR